MAQQKKCSGTQTIPNWLLASNTCTYQVQLLVDGSPITNVVALNSGMTNTQIEILLNSNRTGNVTGFFTVSNSGNDLLITINDIILSSSSAGQYNVIATGSGFPCPDFQLVDAFLTCSIIPNKNNNGVGFYFPATLCFARQYDNKNNLIECPKEIRYPGQYGIIYTLISSDERQCCYEIKKY